MEMVMTRLEELEGDEDDVLTTVELAVEIQTSFLLDFSMMVHCFPFYLCGQKLNGPPTGHPRFLISFLQAQVFIFCLF